MAISNSVMDADGKPTHPEDPCSRPQSSLKRRPRGIHLVDLDGDLALAGGNFPDVEAKEGSLGSVRQLADLDVDRLRRAVAIEDQGTWAPTSRPAVRIRSSAGSATSWSASFTITSPRFKPLAAAGLPGWTREIRTP